MTIIDTIEVHKVSSNRLRGESQLKTNWKRVVSMGYDIFQKYLNYINE